MGAWVQELDELMRREAEQGVVPDPQIDAFMKVCRISAPCMPRPFATPPSIMFWPPRGGGGGGVSLKSMVVWRRGRCVWGRRVTQGGGAAGGGAGGHSVQCGHGAHDAPAGAGLRGRHPGTLAPLLPPFLLALPFVSPSHWGWAATRLVALMVAPIT